MPLKTVIYRLAFAIARRWVIDHEPADFCDRPWHAPVYGVDGTWDLMQELGGAQFGPAPLRCTQRRRRHRD